jgi:diguanylate cyclase (GGDEF)-like protein
MLIETDTDGARLVAERVRDAFRAKTFLHSHGQALKLTASIGVSTFPEDGDEPNALINAADQAMYRVKESGRDGVLAAADRTS